MKGLPGVVRNGRRDVQKVRPGDSVLITFRSCWRRATGCPRTATLALLPAPANSPTQLIQAAARDGGPLRLSNGTGALSPPNFFGPVQLCRHAITMSANVVKFGSGLAGGDHVPGRLAGIQSGCGTRSSRLARRSRRQSVLLVPGGCSVWASHTHIWGRRSRSIHPRSSSSSRWNRAASSPWSSAPPIAIDPIANRCRPPPCAPFAPLGVRYNALLEATYNRALPASPDLPPSPRLDQKNARPRRPSARRDNARMPGRCVTRGLKTFGQSVKGIHRRRFDPMLFIPGT